MTILALTIPLVWSGSLQSVADLIALAGSLVLVLVILAFGGIAYKGLKGELEWPGETTEEVSEDEVKRGRADDEWKYY